ncbi:hypothetical protein LNV08_11990 [Paucibacter sp. TC2R-5]|uniref:hypothetical protein n=1 Tax=Paucibacter sp. TC2R-5 TaxID=2893555 RepID=UPI0021E3D409|nr:hypothetical protein [Paucibacter sp. TC2R-5]MCV2359691.1 hypothetical protein [Paucibacter sp. TC2R-5]
MSPTFAKFMGAIALAALLFGAYSYWPAAQDRQPTIATTSTTAPVALPSTAASSPIALPLALAASAVSNNDFVKAPNQLNPIGSEGYAPHIDRAHLGDDPKSAWQAVTWLQQCAINNTNEQHFQLILDSATLPKDAAAAIAQQLQDTRVEGRRCQTVVAQHRALLPALALKAMRGQVVGAAAVYAGQVNFSTLEPAMQAELGGAIRADAGAGDAMTLLNTALSGKAWGFSDEERLSYLAVYASLGPGNLAHLKGLLQNGAITNMAPPTDAQKAQAEVAAQKLIDGIKARRPPA